jgi:DNA topoisomerase-2
MTPWFRGFKGSVEMSEDGKSFVTKGEMAIRGTHVKVTELPIGMWTDTFKDLAEANPDVERVVNKSTENEVDFEIRLTREMPEEELWKAFRLAKKFSVGNMHLFDPRGTIHKYVDSLEILNDFLEVRLQYYEKRKDLMEREATRDLEKIEAKLAFVTGVVEGVIPLFKATDEEIKEGAEKAGIRGHLETFVDLPAKTFTAAKIKGLHGERDRAIKRRADILAKSANDMYVEDLEEIEAAI